MTREEWIVVVGTINSRWPDRPRDGAWADAWWPTVAGLDFGAAMAALEVYGREGNGFPPDGGQIARLAAEVAEPEGFDTAWDALRREVGRTGYLGAPTFADPALAAAVAAFGWRPFCNLPESQMQTARAQIRDLYREAAKRTRRREGLAALPAGPHRAAIESSLGELRERLTLTDSGR